MIEAPVIAIAVATSVSTAAAASALRRDVTVVDRLPGSAGSVIRATAAPSRSGWLLRAGDPSMVRILGIAAAILASFAPPPFNAAAIGGVIAALKGPEMILARRERHRLRRIDREIPLLLDALSSAALAGLPPQSALRRAASVVGGPLSDELRDTVDAVDLGARWREQLDVLVARCPNRDLSRAVGVMFRTDAVGASFADGITTLAVRAREARRTDLAQRARTAPVKMLFPLVFLVLPAFLLLTVVPLLVATLDQIR